MSAPGRLLVLVIVLGLLSGPVGANPARPPAPQSPPPAPDDVAPDKPREDEPEPGLEKASADDQLEELRGHVEALLDEVEALREQVAGLAAQLASTRPALHTYRLPEVITFAGEPVSMDRWDVAERLEREFYVALGDPAQVVLWLRTLVLGAARPLAGFAPSTTGRFSGVYRGPYRVLFAFDPRRTAILLIGGNKTGDPGWYDRMIPVADDLYDEHLKTLRKEGLI